MRVSDLSIRWKLLIAIGVAFVAMTGGLALVVHRAFDGIVRQSAEQALAAAARQLSNAERSDLTKLAAASEVLITEPGLREAFAARDRDRLEALASPILAGLREHEGITHLYFVTPEPERTCFLRVHDPRLFGDTVERATLSEAIRTRRVASGKELGKTAFALRSVRPYYDGEHLLGYVELAEEMDPFLADLKSELGDDYVLLLDKGSLDREAWGRMRAESGRPDDWDALPERVLADATLPPDEARALGAALGDVPDEGQVLDERDRDGARYLRGVLPVRDASGRRAGVIVVRHDVTSLRTALASIRWQSLALTVLVIGVLSAALLALINRVVVARLARMMGNMEDLSLRLAGGEYDLAPATPPAAADEIGRFEGFFGRFLALIAQTLKSVSQKSPSSKT